MPDSDTILRYRYGAFISYSHQDAVFAGRLHRALERYRLPRRLLAARVTETRRLRPVFRDQDELPAAPDLSAVLRAALADSAFLIVICSAHTARSAWVAQEIALFREMRGDSAVLAVLVDGCTDADFHALLSVRAQDGHLIEPLAADFRKHAAGKRLALLKLVAVLSAVPLDALVQRDAQRQIRQVVAAAALSVVVAAVMAVLAVRAERAEEAKVRAQESTRTFLVHQRADVRTKLKAYGRLDIIEALDRSRADYYRSEDISRLSPADQTEFAKALQDVGQDQESSGLLDDAQRQFAEAYAITAALLREAPGEPGRIFAQAQSEYWVGEIAWRKADYAVAETAFHAYAALADRLVQDDAQNTDWLTETAYAQSNLGTFSMRAKKALAQAERYYLAALAAFVTVAARHPGDAALRREISDMYGWLGDAARLRGDCDAAARYRTQAKQIMTALWQADPANTELRSAMIANELAFARIELCRGDADGALRRLASGRDDAAALAAADPVNTDRARQVRIFDLFEVAAWLSMSRSLRPDDAVIAAALGDCRAEAAKRGNGELARYCFILRARRAAQDGRADDAQEALRLSRSLAGRSDDALSPNWGLDFTAEAKLSADHNP